MEEGFCRYTIACMDRPVYSGLSLHPNRALRLTRCAQKCYSKIRSSNPADMIQRITYYYEYAQLAELADALDLGSSGRPWGFESLVAHHNVHTGGSIDFSSFFGLYCNSGGINIPNIIFVDELSIIDILPEQR